MRFSFAFSAGFECYGDVTTAIYHCAACRLSNCRMKTKLCGLALVLVATTAVMGSMIGCRWFSESTFELAKESRLPKFIVLQRGVTRAEVSMTMSYYVKPWARSATFTLRDEKGRIRTRLDGKLKGLVYINNPEFLKLLPPDNLTMVHQ
jgi:hypothetical protein